MLKLVAGGAGASLGPGQSLDPSQRRFFEPRFGRDFSQVRIHTGDRAARSAQVLNARAFSVGQDIAFGLRQYQPHDNEGKKLLAHELAHTLEQRADLVTRKVSPDYAKIESRLSYGVADWAITEAEARDVLVLLAALSATDLADTLGKMETDGLVARLLENMSSADQVTYSTLFVSLWQAHVPPHPSLATEAELLGGETITMDSYSNYQSKTWTWFFSPNNTLGGGAGKPSSFADWTDWNRMHWQSQVVIADLAGLNPRRMAQNPANLATLQAAYSRWSPLRLAVFQSGTSATNTCNVFLGDSLFLDGKNQVKDGKYYSADEVFAGTGKFNNIPPQAVSRGDIAAWSYGHVEVITSVDPLLGEFCSRGGYRTPIGGEKCGGADRKISKTGLKFFRIR